MGPPFDDAPPQPSMKILLAYPYCLEDRIHVEDAGVVPMGVYFVGAVLRETGHEVTIANWSALRDRPEEVERALRAERPDVIGFSVLNANRWAALDIAESAKRIDPKVVTVFGGIGASTLWKHFLTHFPAVDFAVVGEGERSFAALIAWLASADARTEEPKGIPGIAFRRAGRPFCSEDAEPVRDLDALPDPSRHFTYRHLALTRGCPMKCSFCGSPRFWGSRVRFHSPQYFVDQMERLHRRGENFFFVSDDTFTLDKDRVVAVCREILRRKLSVSWAAISHVSMVDADILYWMRRAGCIQISYGVESGSPEIRRRLGKSISDEHIRSAFSLTVSHGILARAYFIYGCPGENWETIEETLSLIEAIRPLSAVFYILDLFPGTALYEDYRKRSGATDDIWLRRIEDVLYFEIDPSLSSEQVTAFGARLRSRYYERLPRYAESVELIDRKELYGPHAEFLSRLAMTFECGDYAGVDAIPDKERVAETLYRRALRYAKVPRAYLGLGILAQKRRDYDGSIEVLAEGLRRFPRDPQLGVCLAVSHMNTGDFPRALEILRPLEGHPEADSYIEACRRAVSERR
ncbi:MAG: cobalamin-dependent protein [Desulfobacteraceae bacterium]|nr:cobalamin-dependent protein [Desulfobacteraceae bacterium]